MQIRPESFRIFILSFCSAGKISSLVFMVLYNPTQSFGYNIYQEYNDCQDENVVIATIRNLELKRFWLFNVELEIQVSHSHYLFVVTFATIHNN